MLNFADILKVVQGTGFVGIDTETVVPLLGGKGNPHQGRVTKRVTGSNVMVFQNKFVNGYDALVRRRLESEGKDATNFVLGPRKWGTRIQGLPLVQHEKDGQVKWYFEVIFINAGDVEYFLDGQPIAKSDIQGLKDAPEESEQGGLTNKVIIRTYAIDSIRSLRINHNNYNGPFEVIL